MAQIDDPEVRAAIEGVGQPQPKSIDTLNAFRYNSKVKVFRTKIGNMKAVSPFSKYPLLDELRYCIDRKVQSEIIVYMNAKYKIMSGTAAKKGN